MSRNKHVEMLYSIHYTNIFILIKFHSKNNRIKGQAPSLTRLQLRSFVKAIRIANKFVGIFTRSPIFFLCLFFLFFFKIPHGKTRSAVDPVIRGVADPLNNKVAILRALITSPGQIPGAILRVSIRPSLSSSCLTPRLSWINTLPAVPPLFSARVFSNPI